MLIPHTLISIYKIIVYFFYTGLFIFLTVLTGWLCKKNKCKFLQPESITDFPLKIVALVFVILAMSLSILIYGLWIHIVLNNEEARNSLSISLLHDWVNRNKLQEFWAILQSNNMCCGFNGPDDYSSLIPNSCCTSLGSSSPCDFISAHKMGCLQAIENGYSATSIAGIIVSCIGIIRSVWYITTYLIARNWCCWKIERTERNERSE